MISLLVYQIRAVWQFCMDNNFTPYVTVNATHDNVQVPIDYIKNGNIVLNMSLTATQDLDIGDEFVSFKARFNGKSFEIFFPIESITSIFSKETLEGLVLKSNTARKWNEHPQIKARSPSELKEINKTKESEYKKPENKLKKNINSFKVIRTEKDNVNSTNKTEDKNIVSLDDFRSKKKSENK